jgi:hypothetical protein
VLIFRRGLAIFFLAIAIPYLLAPVYRFPPPQQFAGEALWNPYAHMAGHWQRANLHAHGRSWGGLTNGYQSDEEVVRAYKEHGYAVAGVSNYQWISSQHGVDTMPLYEHGYNIAKGHQLAIGARSVEWLDFPVWQGRDQKQYIIDRVGATADLVALNHPNTAYTDDDLRDLTGYQLLEVVNGPFPVEDAWDAALSNGHLVWVLANDDSHNLMTARRTFIAWNMIDAPSAGTADIINALRHGRTYAVSLVGENADASLKDIQLENGTLTVSSAGVPATYLFVGQDGTVRKTADQVMQASYTIEPKDTYIRTVIRTPNIVMYLNPIVRYTGAGVPSRRATPDMTATWLQRGFLSAAYAAVVFLLWRRPKPAGPAVSPQTTNL